MDRFFKILRRVNSVLFLLVLIGTGASAAWCAWVFAEWRRQFMPDTTVIAAVEDDEAGTGAADLIADLPADLKLGDAETITGTRIQMFRLASVAYGQDSGRHGEAIRNILLLADDRPGATWLLPNHDNLILEVDQVRARTSDDGATPAARALYIQYVAMHEISQAGAETGVLNVALSRVDGSNLVRVLDGVAEVVSYEQFDADSLSIAYRRGGELRLARISLDTFATLSDEKAADIPDKL